MPTVIQRPTRSTSLEAGGEPTEAAAGRRLAELLQPYRSKQTLVLALPSTGLGVAYEIAHLLRLPLDLMISQEFFLPRTPAVLAGALSEGGGLYLNAGALQLPGVDPLMLWDAARYAHEHMDTLIRRYRHGRTLVPVARRAVVIFDYALSSGLASLAAIQALHYAGVRSCIVATTRSQPEAARRVAERADALLSLATVDAATDRRLGCGLPPDEHTITTLLENFEFSSMLQSV